MRAYQQMKRSIEQNPTFIQDFKTFSKLGIKDNFLKLIKKTIKKQQLRANIILNNNNSKLSY